MATFAYSGRTRQGRTVTGERIAETMDGAVAALRREQILVTQINPVKEAAPKAAKPIGQECQREEPGGLHAPVLGHDRRRPAARAVSRDPRDAGRRQELRVSHSRDTDRRRERCVAGGCDEEASEDVRPAVHEHDCGRRGRRYSRHDSEAPGDLHRKGRQAEGSSEVRDDLPDRGHRDRGPRGGRDSVEGHPDLRQSVCRPWRELPLPTRIVIAASNGLVRFMPFILVGIGAAAFGVPRVLQLDERTPGHRCDHAQAAGARFS